MERLLKKDMDKRMSELRVLGEKTRCEYRGVC